MEETLAPSTISGKDLQNAQLRTSSILFTTSPLLTPNTRTQIRNQFESLPEKETGALHERNFILGLFERFIYDPGLNRDWEMSEEEYNRIRSIDPNFTVRRRNGAKIFNRDTLIRIAKDRILMGDRNIAFVNFDIKSLRAADIGGYAEHVLRDFAEILQEVAASHQTDIEIIPGRTGGDEFSYLVSSADSINQDQLKKIYDAVQEKFRDKRVYLGEEKEVDEEETTISPITITAGKAELKDELDNSRYAIANDVERKRKFFARSFATGQIPDGEVLDKEKDVSETEFNKLIEKEKRETVFLDQNFNFWKTGFNNFFKKYPEFAEEKEVIGGLIANGKSQLAASMFYLMKNYVVDKLLGREIYRMPDFINHLYNSKRKGRLIMFSLPWLKNFNYAVGSTTTNNIITSMSDKIAEEMLARDFPIWEIGRGSGDFVAFMPEEEIKNDFRFVMNLSVSKMRGTGDLRETPFSDGVPIFVSSIQFNPTAVTDRAEISQIIRNVDGQNKMHFMHWLNTEYNKDPKRGEAIADFYLQQRELDRKRDLRYWLKRLIGEEYLNPALVKKITS